MQRIKNYMFSLIAKNFQIAYFQFNFLLFKRKICKMRFSHADISIGLPWLFELDVELIKIRKTILDFIFSVETQMSSIEILPNKIL